MKRKFGIQCYDLEKDNMRQQMPFRGLVVFTREVPGNFDNVAELCAKIIAVVKQKLPFILCLKNVKVEDTSNHMILLNEITKMLRIGLDTTHSIIRIESPPGKLCSFAKLYDLQIVIGDKFVILQKFLSFSCRHYSTQR